MPPEVSTWFTCALTPVLYLSIEWNCIRKPYSLSLSWIPSFSLLHLCQRLVTVYRIAYFISNRFNTEWNKLQRMCWRNELCRRWTLRKVERFCFVAPITGLLRDVCLGGTSAMLWSCGEEWEYCSTQSQLWHMEELHPLATSPLRTVSGPHWIGRLGESQCQSQHCD
jgi:hypothetical protein